MNVRIPKSRTGLVFKKPFFREDHREKVLVHGAFNYKCQHCGKVFRMWLEDGVEGKNKKQPCPFIIACPECGGEAQHISWYSDIELNKLEHLQPGMKFFAFDKSKKDSACGKPSVYVGKNKNDTAFYEQV